MRSSHSGAIVKRACGKMQTQCSQLGRETVLRDRPVVPTVGGSSSHNTATVIGQSEHKRRRIHELRCADCATAIPVCDSRMKSSRNNPSDIVKRSVGVRLQCPVVRVRHCKLLRCASTLRSASSSEPLKMRIFTSYAACPLCGSGTSGSTCWQVSSGLLQTFPGSRAKLAATQVRSSDRVAIMGTSTGLDL